MSKTLKQIPKNTQLLAVGNFFRAHGVGERWHLDAWMAKKGDTPAKHPFNIEVSCIFGVGREFIQQEERLYRSSGFELDLVLPPIDQWTEQSLGSCGRLPQRLANIPEVAGQRCFVFQAGEYECWLPKFELARKLYFHAGALVRAAFEPNGLDMLFSVQDEQSEVHIYSPLHTGIAPRLLQSKSHREHFSWLLLNNDVRRSFESIWRCQNEEQRIKKDGAEWSFNFQPPTSLEGVKASVIGSADKGAKLLLIGQIFRLDGLKQATEKDIYFHHPSLKQAVRSNDGDTGKDVTPPSFPDAEIDAEEEPKQAQDRQLIELPDEGLFYDKSPSTKVAYNGRRPSLNGRKTDQQSAPGEVPEEVPRDTPDLCPSETLGVLDDIAGGTGMPAEFQQLGAGVDDPQDSRSKRFVQLQMAITDIGEHPGVKLDGITIKPLPKVKGFKSHQIESRARCYLIAKFSLTDGRVRYLLDIDTSDAKKNLSTLVFSYKDGDNFSNNINAILVGLIREYLRWPMGIIEHNCCAIGLVRHPDKMEADVPPERLKSWTSRLSESLCSRNDGPAG